MTGWLLIKGPFPYGREGCELPVRPGTWVVACRDFVHVSYTWFCPWVHQSSYPGVTAEENILCFGVVAGTEQSTWCQECVSKEVPCRCCHLQHACNCWRCNQSYTFGHEIPLEFQLGPHTFENCRSPFLISLLLSYKKPNIQLKSRMIILGFKYSYALVPYALWHWWLSRI